jgi:hypothetical protein
LSLSSKILFSTCFSLLVWLLTVFFIWLEELSVWFLFWGFSMSLLSYSFTSFTVFISFTFFLLS